MNSLKTKVRLIAAAAANLPLTALAAVPDKIVPIPRSSVSQYGTFNGVLGLIARILGWAYVFLLAFSVAIVVYAAYLYVFANGDSEKVSKANRIILYAAIGVAVAVLASVVPDVVRNFLGGR